MSEEKLKPKPSSIPPDVDKTPVAQEIWCYSTKEKTETWHVVVNHDAKGIVDRVQCKTSGVIHKYKRQNKPPGPVNKKPSTRKTTTKVPAVDFESLWFNGVKAWGSKAAKTYSMESRYAVGDVIEHSTFGKGVVQLRRDNKIDTVFQTGMKVLLSPKS